VAQALGVRESGHQPLRESLIMYLRDKQLLLLLDNVEHLLPTMPLVSDLLAACSQLKVLATSRAALRVRGEHEVVVPPLALPDRTERPHLEALPQYGAVALFLARAQEVTATFALSPATAPAVVAICRRLDGLPLAIELAAVWVKLLSPQAREQRLAHCLPLLTEGAQDLPPRQRTLRGTIAWSHDLLGPGEQVLFARLGVFRGGWMLEAAEAVCGAPGDIASTVLEGLRALVTQSLVQVDEQVDGEPRFVMLETIREYARERLAASGEEATLHRAHAAYYLSVAEEAEPALVGPEPGRWLARLEREHDNLRAALRWAEDSGEIVVALRLAGALARFWYLRGHLSEGRGWLEGLLARARSGDGVPLVSRAKACSGAATLAFAQGDYQRAVAHDEESLTLFRAVGNTAAIARTLASLGNTHVSSAGPSQRAAALFEESLALFRALEDKAGIAYVLTELGMMAQLHGAYGRARALAEEGLALRRDLGDKPGMAHVLQILGNMVREQGDYGYATALFEESLTLRRELSHKAGIAFALNGLGNVAREQGDAARAAVLLEESLGLLRALGHRAGIATALKLLGAVMCQQGLYGRAAALLEESLVLFETMRDQAGIVEVRNNLAGLALVQGDGERALTLHQESLGLAGARGSARSVAECLEGVAAAQARAAPVRAARLWGAAEALRAALGTPLPPVDRAGYERAVAAACAALAADSPDGTRTFADAWAAGQTLSIEQAIVEARHPLVGSGVRSAPPAAELE
jgi:predicted ATPase